MTTRLFGSKTKTSVASSTIRLIEDTPDVLNQSILGSIRNGTDISNDIKMTIVGAYVHKVNLAYAFGRDKFTNGLPEGDIGRINIDQDKILELLTETIVTLPEGHTIEMVDAVADTLNGEPLAREWFANLKPDWDVDDKFTFQSGSVDYVRERRITEDQILAVFGNITIDPDGDMDIDDEVEEIVTPVNPKYMKFKTGSKDYYIYSRYFIKDAEGVRVGQDKLWNYWVGSNVYPEIHPKVEELGKNFYMPIVPIRINNKTLRDDDTELYKTSKQLLNILKLDISQIMDAIDDNPDVKEIDHAYVMLGANVFSKAEPTIKYLFKYFFGMGVAGNDLVDLDIRDGTYNSTLSIGEITLEDTRGRKGKVDSYTSYIDKQNQQLWLYHQYDAVNYRSVMVDGITLYNHISGAGKSVRTSLDADEEDRGALIIPLNVTTIYQEFSPLEANDVYYDALVLVANSFKKTKLKWYQTGIFKIVTIVVAVAISVISYGTATGAAIALIGGLVVNIALELILDIAVKLFGDVLGSIIGVIVAIVAIVYGGTYFNFVPDIAGIANVAINISSAVGQNLLESGMEDLMGEIAAFESIAEAKSEELESIQNQLKQQVQIDPLAIYGAVDMIPGAPIDYYYTSKIELPIQLGFNGYEQLSNWVDSKLQLPSLSLS